MREKLPLELTGFKKTQVGSLQLPQHSRAQGEPSLSLFSTLSHYFSHAEM